ncbi:four helix bundle protein [candidate division WOR-3 bacterium]|uniref:Four helix bundle protein n=1 Tax=candidate division WOR-3 bacterium TaxID=2052148 RepID=A0A938BR69_UNCW3|nr:four helix bundle protein [candidate division WOR-3 bacterium]
MRDIRNYDVFRLADRLALMVYRITVSFPSEEKYGLVSQMRRAALSIPINLAEGAARSGARDFAHFVDMALGSCEEVRCEAHVASELGYMRTADCRQLDSSYEDVSKMLNKLRCKIRNSDPRSGGERRKAEGERRSTASKEEASNGP